jgi:putative PIN family toxin of toxin-antitoxin system
MQSNMRLILDTNFLISAIVFDNQIEELLIYLLRHNIYQIYFSDDTWNELCAKLDSPKLSELIIKSKRNISRDELSHYLNLLFESSITRITVSRTIELCRDPDDDKFL